VVRAAIRGVERNGVTKVAGRRYYSEERLFAALGPDWFRRRLPPRGALAVLGLTALATPADIRRAFRRRAKRVHPDAGGTDAAFVKLKRAHDEALAALRDP